MGELSKLTKFKFEKMYKIDEKEKVKTKKKKE